MDKARSILSDITVHSKYAKYVPAEQRREVWEEIVGRNFNMHFNKFKHLGDEFITEMTDAYSYVLSKKVLPSMRSLQFSSKPIELSPNRQFNCCYLPIDDISSFSEIMFLLLGGTGVGYSVQIHDIEKLPELVGPKKRTRRYLIGDSIEGWADAVKILIESYFLNKSDPIYDYRDIRPKGSHLITSGGKAPGAQPLKDCIHNIRKVLDAALVNRDSSTQCTSIEVHDMICYIADAVLSGGIRRAALISLFSFDDNEMLECKFGKWWELNPQRARANNSAVALRNKIRKKTFFEFFERVRASNSGEPSIYFTNDKSYGTNPSLRKGTKVLTDNGIFPIDSLEDRSFLVPNLHGNWSEARCWKSGKDIPLWKLTLDDDSVYYSSPQHEWPIYVNGRYVKCSSKELQKGDLLPINVFNRNKLHNGTKGTEDLGFLIGWLYGDGCLTKRSDTGKYVASFVVSKKEKDDVLKKLLNIIEDIDGISRNPIERESTFEFQVGSPKFINYIMNDFGVNKKEHGLPKQLWSEWSDRMIRGFIDGIFSSDGHVPKDSHGISLVSSKHKLTYDIKELLGFYGIKTKVYTKTIKNPMFPNKKQYNKNYTYYSLRTTLAGRIKFSELFTLSVMYKQNVLKTKILGNKNNINQNFMKLKSIELTTLKEDVWDISVKDDTHCFHLPTVTTGNCCEVALKPFQMCNLTTINVSDVTTQEDMNARAKAATVIGTIQASYTDFHYLRDIWKKTTEKEALLGVSMTGISSGGILDLNLKEAAKIVIETNRYIAGLIGINAAARLTCIKPEGCQKKETIVSTKDGILSLEELGDINSEEVWSDHNIDIYTDAGIKNSTKFYKNGKAKTKKILTDGGIELESTYNHMYRVLTEEGNYIWTRADELEEGMVLPYSVGEYNGGSIQPLTRISPINSNQKIIKQPLNISNDLAWFLGLYFGDGSNHKKGIRIHGNFHEQKGFDKLTEIVNTLFDLSPKLLRHTANDGRCSIYINSTMLLSFLSANGLLKNKSYEIEIPEIIRRSPKDIIESFIDGYATADGCTKSKTRSFCTTSKTMADQLVVVLRSIGKDCKMRLMSPTETSFGSKMRYWIQERKGRLGELSKIRNYMMKAYADLSEKGLHNLSIDTIISISDGECETYDIKVNDDSHTYLANSYVSHNTASLVVGSSSGIHAWHSPYYIRRMRFNKNEPIHKYLKRAIPDLLEDEVLKPELETVLSVPVKAPEGSIFRTEPALELLERGKFIYDNWVTPGHISGQNTHNVSITVSVKENEWTEVGVWMWENRHSYNGIALLPYDGGTYTQAPFEECTEEVYNELFEKVRNIDLTKVKEEDDNTNHKEQIACGGSGCTITQL